MLLTDNTLQTGVGLPNAAQELLLTAALGDAESALSAWNLWRQDHDLNTLDNDSRRILPLVGHNLNQLGVKIPDSEAIVEITRLGWARNQFLFKSIAGVAQLFNENGIDFLFTKGLPLALIHYPSSALRPMNDGDVLVRLAQFDRAVELLKNAGWVHALDDIPSEAHHAMPFRNAAHQEIDLHRFALGECPFSTEDEEFWRSALPVSVGGASALTINPTDLLFVTCVNSVHSPLRWVADAVLLIRNNTIDWQRFVKQAQKRKLVFVTKMALGYLLSRFVMPLPSTTIDALNDIPNSWLEKREYYAWRKTDSQVERLLLRYASYCRISGVQNPIGFLSYLRLLGKVNSLRDMRLWLSSKRSRNK